MYILHLYKGGILRPLVLPIMRININVKYATDIYTTHSYTCNSTSTCTWPKDGAFMNTDWTLYLVEQGWNWDKDEIIINCM